MLENRPFNPTPAGGRGMAQVDNVERNMEEHQARMREAIELEHEARAAAPRRGPVDRIRALFRRQGGPD
jgi:hypothetical protein